MRKYLLLTITTFFMVANLYAGCMKGEIKQLNAKLENSDIDASKKEQVAKLIKDVIANEHSNSTLAFESYEKALSILN